MEIRQTKGHTDEGQATLYIDVDGKEEIWGFPGEPEDFSLERDLKFIYKIVPLMKRAWEAGKRGEAFEEIEEDEK